MRCTGRSLSRRKIISGTKKDPGKERGAAPSRYSPTEQIERLLGVKEPLSFRTSNFAALKRVMVVEKTARHGLRAKLEIRQAIPPLH